MTANVERSYAYGISGPGLSLDNLIEAFERKGEDTVESGTSRYPSRRARSLAEVHLPDWDFECEDPRDIIEQRLRLTRAPTAASNSVVTLSARAEGEAEDLDIYPRRRRILPVTLYSILLI